MKPKHQRLAFIAVSVLFLCAATLFTLRAFRDNMVFFYTPSELAGQPATLSKLIRLGGLVEAGSIRHGKDDDVRFRLSDGKSAVEVHYKGMLPALFREGQGAVSEGRMEQGVFEAGRVLTKHDEKYMPKDVVDRLKQSGQWRGEQK